MCTCSKNEVFSYAISHRSWDRLALSPSFSAPIVSPSQLKYVGTSLNSWTMGNYVSEESLPTYGSFLALVDVGLLSNSGMILNDGNHNINDHSSTHQICLDISEALYDSQNIFNDKNYNIDDRSSIYQICLDISEALINQICSDISEAFSNNSLRIIKLLVNLCSQLLRAIKLSMNIRSRLLSLKLLIS